VRGRRRLVRQCAKSSLDRVGADAIKALPCERFLARHDKQIRAQWLQGKQA